MKYAVVESTNMGSTHYAERIFDAVADKDIENGTFGYLDGLADGESVIYKFVPGLKDGEKIVMVDNPAWTEDESRITNQRRDQYINKAGTPFRVRVIKKLDEFALTIEGFSDSSKKQISDNADFNDTPIYLTVNAATGKLDASGTPTSGAAFEAKVMRKRMIGAVLSTPIRNYGYSNAIYEVKVTTLIN